MRKIRGFTLAEVLITLGIIGAVAAMTIPTLIENQRNKTLQVRLKKTYSELNQASKLYLEENDEPVPFAVASGNITIDKFLLTYMKGMTQMNNNRYDTVDEEGDYGGYIFKKYSNFKGTKIKQVCDISGEHSTVSGVLYSWNDNPKNGENGPVLCVDLNGDARPNISGIDYFLFVFTTDGTVIPMGMEHENNTTTTGVAGNFFLDKTNCNKGNNYSCAYWALSDNSPAGSGTYWKDFIGGKQYKK